MRRFTMKPVVSLQTTGVFPIFVTNSRSVPMVSSLVVSPLTISTSFMITGGLKKWSPAKRSGRVVAPAISTIVRLAGFGQKIVVGGQAAADAPQALLFRALLP